MGTITKKIIKEVQVLYLSGSCISFTVQFLPHLIQFLPGNPHYD